MDWAMEDIVDNYKSFNDHLSGLVNLLNPYYTWSEGSVDINIRDRGLIRLLVEKESDIPRVQVVMKSKGGEEDSVLDIAGYVPPEDLNRSYGEQIKQLAKSFDDSVSDETKKNVMETFMQSSRVIRRALEEIVPAYSEEYDRQATYVKALHPEKEVQEAIEISLPHTVKLNVTTIDDVTVDHNVSYPMIRVFRPYERIPIVYEPESSFSVSHVTAAQGDEREVPSHVLTQTESLIAHYEDLLRIDGIKDGVCQKKS